MILWLTCTRLEGLAGGLAQGASCTKILLILNSAILATLIMQSSMLLSSETRLEQACWRPGLDTAVLGDALRHGGRLDY